MIRVAVLGCGRIGAVHAGNIDDGQLALVLAVAALKSLAERRAVNVGEIG